jgi:hypothetical protein
MSEFFSRSKNWRTRLWPRSTWSRIDRRPLLAPTTDHHHHPLYYQETIVLAVQDQRTQEEGERTRTKGRARESLARRTRKGKDVGSPSPRAALRSPRATLPSPLLRHRVLASWRQGAGTDPDGRRSGSVPGRGDWEKRSQFWFRVSFCFRPVRNERTF